MYEGRYTYWTIGGIGKSGASVPSDIMHFTPITINDIDRMNAHFIVLCISYIPHPCLESSSILTINYDVSYIKVIEFNDFEIFCRCRDTQTTQSDSLTL